MSGELDLLSRAEAASLLQWWLDAGVDLAVDDQPRDWLKPRGSPTPTSPTAERAGAQDEQMPASLDEFQRWLADSAGLPLDQPGAQRILPHGPAGAEVMLVCELPARDDAAAAQPIGGAAWQLMERMLGAIGIPAAAAYSASLACVHLPAARLSDELLDRCGAIMRHHITLVAPKRLLLLGDKPARALLGQSLVEARGRLHRLGKVPTVVTFHPRFLIGRPADKALAWSDLLLLTEDDGG